jgi:hypothetical protein
MMPAHLKMVPSMSRISIFSWERVPPPAALAASDWADKTTEAVAKTPKPKKDGENIRNFNITTGELPNTKVMLGGGTDKVCQWSDGAVPPPLLG